MKIDDAFLAATAVSSTQPTRQVSETTQTTKSRGSQLGMQLYGAAQASDSATMSATGIHLTQGTDVRLDKVASVQQAIASGSYSVSSEALADSLISYMSQR